MLDGVVGVYMFIRVYMCTYGSRCRFTCNCRCKCKVRCIYRCDYVSVVVEAVVVDGSIQADFSFPCEQTDLCRDYFH